MSSAVRVPPSFLLSPHHTPPSLSSHLQLLSTQIHTSPLFHHFITFFPILYFPPPKNSFICSPLSAASCFLFRVDRGEERGMGSDLTDPVVNDDSEATEDATNGSPPNKKRGKVPKKILKAEREKLKREQLNEHFNRLANVLELTDPNNGKASVLNETIRLVNDMIVQITSLRRDNATLLSEFQYMTTEKNELKDETSALEAQVKKMRTELDERLAQSKPDLNLTPPEYWQSEMTTQFMEGHVSQLPSADPTSTPQRPILGPLYVIPIGPDLQAFQKADTAANPPVAVSKPHARYATPTDSWPLHLLSKQPEAT